LRFLWKRPGEYDERELNHSEGEAERFAKRNVAGDGVLLIGDAAGLAYSQSGEGIRPAIESGLLAAKAILAEGGAKRPTLSETYRCLLAQRFGTVQEEWTFNIGLHLPTQLVSSLARILLASQWLSRHVILDRWFLHCDERTPVC
jgi:menaquinone-9 beta-reductase